MSKEMMMLIVSRIIQSGNYALSDNDDSLFYKGKLQAYYEVIDIIQSELEANGESLEDYGINFDAYKKYEG